MRKVTIIGAGHVGSTTAMRLVDGGMADVAIIDIDGDLARGKALDIGQSLSLSASQVRVVGGSDYRLAEGTDIAVVTAGYPRMPGMSREDLMARNASVVKDVISSLIEVAPDCVIIMVTNPLDEMSYLAWRITGWERKRIMGMAGLLDGSRFAYFIALELGVPPGQVQPMVLGSHGDAMLPLARFTSVADVPLSEKIPAGRLEELEERTRKGGAEIVSLLKKGSAYYAPSACVEVMVRAVLRDEELLAPASVLLQGEYGMEDIFLGVPVILGGEGWRRIVELPLLASEREGLESCARLIRKRLVGLDEWLESAS